MTAKKNSMTTLGDLLRWGCAQLDTSPTPSLDARLLLCHVTGFDHVHLIAHEKDQINNDLITDYQSLIARRNNSEPISHLIGKKEFWGLEFYITKDVLTPRPDSETIIELALELYPQPPATILDMGTGSGCLLAAALTEFPQAVGVAIDTSQLALEVAKENVERLGLSERVKLLHQDFSSVQGEFDLILANPPYIPTADRKALPKEVAKYEPEQALFAKENGLAAYSEITKRLTTLLRPMGHIIFEIGQGQADKVEKLLRKAQIDHLLTKKKDLSGIIRVIAGQRGPSVKKNL
ncbi:MAG: peptide chain release factor N(5)-glutamine methyltransferase [bacterium]